VRVLCGRDVQAFLESGSSTAATPTAWPAGQLKSLVKYWTMPCTCTASPLSQMSPVVALGGVLAQQRRSTSGGKGVLDVAIT